jgi:DNA-binding beta-propeller fold protein YncE
MKTHAILGSLALLALGAATACAIDGDEDTGEGESSSELRSAGKCNPLRKDGPLVRGTRLLVALEGGGVVSLDPATGAIQNRYATGPDSFGAAFDESGERAFVTDKTAGTFVEIDPQSDQVVSTLSIGSTPQQLAIAHGRAYVTLSGEASIAVVDIASTPNVLRKIDIGDGTKPHTLSISPDQKTLFATVQGKDPKIVSIPLTDSGEGAVQEYRYDIVPRVVAASNEGAFFTGHHSTGFHKVGVDGKLSTPYMDVPGEDSEARKQIEGAWSNADGSLVGLTHEGRKALVVLSFDSAGKAKKVRDINLSNVPYWVTLDPSERVAYVSIPGASTVEAYDLTSCAKKPMWTRDVGGKAKRMNVKACSN